MRKSHARINEEYKVKKHRIHADSSIFLNIPERPAHIKPYFLEEKGERLSEQYRSAALSILDRPNVLEWLASLSGFGFMIVSGGVVNLNAFGTEIPSVAHPRLYTSSEKEKTRFKEQKDLAKAGGNCPWEYRIGAFEANEWLKFLASKRTFRDEIQYLGTTLEGIF